MNDRSIIVLGVGRTGTSVVTHILQELGVFVGESLHPDNYEEATLYHLNEALIGGNWKDPQLTTTAGLEKRCADFVAERRKHGLWGMKDPRLCFTLPAMLPYLQSTDVRVIVTKRPFDCIVESLNVLPDVNGENNAKIVVKRYQDALKHTLSVIPQEWPVMTIDFDELVENSDEQVARIADFINVESVPEAVKAVEPELRHHTEKPADNSEFTLALMVWNTSHLMKRTLETLCNQTLQNWKLMVIDDMSEDDVEGTLEPFKDRLNIEYHRLQHDMGMRGNTASINYVLEHATSRVIMWSTPEVMLPPGALAAAYKAARDGRKKVFVTIPSHGLTAGLQMEIDNIGWQDDIHNIKHLLDNIDPESFTHRWFNLNFYEHGDVTGKKKKAFGNNQSVAVNRKLWMKEIGLFPYYLDYGSDDPWVSNERKTHGYKDQTLWEHDGYHQWHPKCQYWMAQGKAPNWNCFGHTMSNLMNDPKVPDGGTCEIWDEGNHQQMDEAWIASELGITSLVEALGYKPAQ